MGLQVRVRHSLGEKLIELPDREVDDPIKVGRASGADLQVPSVSIAPQHCILFRYEQHWAVQDVAAANGGVTSGTFVNGQQVIDPVMLQIGDVITIGPDPAAATIEVDPTAAAEGRSGWAGDASAMPAYSDAAPVGAGGPMGPRGAQTGYSSFAAAPPTSPRGWATTARPPLAAAAVPRAAAASAAPVETGPEDQIDFGFRLSTSGHNGALFHTPTPQAALERTDRLRRYCDGSDCRWHSFDPGVET